MQFEYPPRLGWCTKHNSATACKDCEIDRLTAQLAEAKASAEAWQENCRLTEDELEKERNKHADTIGKLAERDGAITCYNEVLAELREEVEKLRHQLAERDAKYVATVQSMIDIAATEYAALLDEVETLRHQSINWVSVFDENMILQTQNAALREEVEKIREANRQLAGAAICPDHLKPENVRKQTAKEIIQRIEECNYQDITGRGDGAYVVEHDDIDAIKAKFGLEVKVAMIK